MDVDLQIEAPILQLEAPLREASLREAPVLEFPSGAVRSVEESGPVGNAGAGRIALADVRSEDRPPGAGAIPPMIGAMIAYKVRLNEFEGPLDLLLFFIKRDEIDIYNIPITRITEEFLEYLHLMTALDLELAGEFIVVAAELCQIKAKMLLPRNEREIGEIEDDPRSDLVRRLLEYRRYKEMAEELSVRSAEQRNVYFRQYFAQDDGAEQVPAEENLLRNVTMFHLMNAFRRAMLRAPRIKRTHDVEMVPVSVEEQSELILSTVSMRGELSLSGLILESLPDGAFEEFSAGVRLWIAVTFVAILDLVRNRMVALRQHGVFEEIILFKP